MPTRQRAAVTLERAEVAFGDLRAAIVMFDDGAGGDLGLVNVQRHNALVHRGQLHPSSPAFESHLQACEPAQVPPTNGLPSKLGGSL